MVGYIEYIDIFPLNQMEHASAFQAMRACTVSQSLQHHDQVHLQLEVPLRFHSSKVDVFT